MDNDDVDIEASEYGTRKLKTALEFAQPSYKFSEYKNQDIAYLVLEDEVSGLRIMKDHRWLAIDSGEDFVSTTYPRSTSPKLRNMRREPKIPVKLNSESHDDNCQVLTKSAWLYFDANYKLPIKLDAKVAKERLGISQDSKFRSKVRALAYKNRVCFEDNVEKKKQIIICATASVI